MRRWKLGGRSTPCTNRAAAAAKRKRKPRPASSIYRFQEEVENALAGRLLDGTRDNNGSGGGTFRGGGGVQVAERRLRLLMGLPPSDGRLIRPADEPILAPVAFDWHEITARRSPRRAELRRQRWVIRRRELELIASRNYLLPRLDAIGSLSVARLRPRPAATTTPPLGRDSTTPTAI